MKVPIDAVDRSLQRRLRRSRTVERRTATIANDLEERAAGSLDELPPELAAWVKAALTEIGELLLANGVPAFAVRGCWRGALDNYTISAMPRESRPLVWGDPDRRPIRLSQPHGARRRRWQVGVVGVRDELLEIGVVRQGVLRSTLDQISRKLADKQGGRTGGA